MDMNEMNMNENAEVNYNEVPQQQEEKGLSIAAMVIGIVSLVLSCCISYVPIATSIVAIILAAVSLAKKKGGKGMAVAGLVCGIIALILSVLMAVFSAAILAALEAM